MPSVQHSAFRLQHSPRGFTLTEILIVIGIIVLVLALAVPALNLLSGSNSINGAENNVSAMLGRARADALALQQPTGVMFFIDDASRNVMLAEVYAVGEPNPTGTRQVYLDLVADRDYLAIPKGVSAQVIDNAAVTAGPNPVRSDDGYIGYNEFPTGSTGPGVLLRYGGVILFDAQGRLYNPTYGFDFVNSAGVRTKMAGLFEDTAADLFDPPPTPAPFRIAGYGLVLYDRDAFIGGSGASDEDAANKDSAGAITPAERGEEQWLDDNATPLLINRYNGTLVRGE